MTSFQVVTWLMIFTALETIAIMAVWAARSVWWKYQAGRSLMALMVGQIGIIGLAIASRLFGYDYPNRDLHYTIFYTILALAMAWVGATIVKAQTADRQATPSHGRKE